MHTEGDFKSTIFFDPYPTAPLQILFSDSFSGSMPFHQVTKFHIDQMEHFSQDSKRIQSDEVTVQFQILWHRQNRFTVPLKHREGRSVVIIILHGVTNSSKQPIALPSAWI